MSREAPPPYQGDPSLWAEDLNDYLIRSKQVIGQLTSDDKATQDGIFLWDTTGYPVVSKDGEFRQIVLADGHGDFTSGDLELTQDTQKEITWSAVGALEGLSINGNQIVFEESGHYLACFSAQMYSSNSSQVDFSFWSVVNGSSGYTMVASLHNNTASTVISRSAVFSVPAGATLVAKAACTQGTGYLKAFAANVTTGAPASPAATLSIVRVHQ